MTSARWWLLASGLLLSACGSDPAPDAATPDRPVVEDVGDDLAPEAALVDAARDATADGG